MKKSRLEAFSDGVLAIVITIMVLELAVPEHETSLAALRPVLPSLLAYLLSFVYLGIYWNNHHHLLHAVERVSGGILWANLHLLFWLSLVPFTTAWMGHHPEAPTPTATYGFVLLMAALAYWNLERCIVKHHGADSVLARAIHHSYREWLSPLLYATAIPAAFLSTWIAAALYVLVALIWIVPDKRIERVLADRGE